MSQTKRLKKLAADNVRLKKLVADPSNDKYIPKASGSLGYRPPVPQTLQLEGNLWITVEGNACQRTALLAV